MLFFVWGRESDPRPVCSRLYLLSSAPSQSHLHHQTSHELLIKFINRCIEYFHRIFKVDANYTSLKVTEIVEPIDCYILNNNNYIIMLMHK